LALVGTPRGFKRSMPDQSSGPRTPRDYPSRSNSVSLSIWMVAGYREAAEREKLLVAAARYVPNTQFLTIPFQSELIRADYSYENPPQAV